MLPTRRPLATGLVAAALAVTVSRPAQSACTPAKAGTNAVSLTGAWKQAFDELLGASANSSSPWGCHGGTIDLVERDGSATLTVTSDEGHAVSREVTAPADVAPVGKALLLTPLPPQREATPEETPAKPPVAASLGAPAGPRADAGNPAPARDRAEHTPDVLLSLLVSPRYAGSSNMMLGGVAAQVGFPFGAWVAGGWARVDALSTVLDGDHRNDLAEVCLGASFGRTLVREPLELRLSALASLAVIMTDSGEANATAADGRGGLELRGLWPLTRRLRLAAAIDGELAPAQLDSSGRHRDGDQTGVSLPSYTLGVGVGLELSL